MRLKTRILIFIFTTVCNGIGVQAQDIHLSQFFSNPLLLNPAFAGQVDGGFRITNSYRQQWLAVSDNNYVTNVFSCDGQIYQNKVATGLSIVSDRAGNSHMKTTSVLWSLATKVKIDEENDLSFGLTPGWTHRTIDYGGLTWDSQYNGSIFDNQLSSKELNLQPTTSFFDISAGVNWHSLIDNKHKLNAGIAAFHLNQPNQSVFSSTDDPLFIRWATHVETELKFGDYKLMTYIPSILFLSQGPLYELNFGMKFKRNFGLDSRYTGVNLSSNLMYGVSYRLNDAFIGYFGYEYKKYLTIGLSYDVNISGFRKATNLRGAFEFNCTYKIYNTKRIFKIVDVEKK